PAMGYKRRPVRIFFGELATELLWLECRRFWLGRRYNSEHSLEAEQWRAGWRQPKNNSPPRGNQQHRQLSPSKRGRPEDRKCHRRNKIYTERPAAKGAQCNDYSDGYFSAQ